MRLVTIYDLAERVERLHPEFEPRVLDERPACVSGEVAYRVTLRTPYWRETMCQMVLFVAEKSDHQRWLGTVYCRTYGEWWSRTPSFARTPLELFAAEMARVIKDLGSRVLNERRPLSVDYRREFYGPAPEGINAKVVLAGGE